MAVLLFVARKSYRETFCTCSNDDDNVGDDDDDVDIFRMRVATRGQGPDRAHKARLISKCAPIELHFLVACANDAVTICTQANR